MIHKSFKIMGHLVIGYPNLSESYETVKIYIKNGIEILELQIPFSDPTADGTIITSANKIAIQNQVSWNDCLNFLKNLRNEFPNQEIFLMTYLNKLLSLDLNKFSSQLIRLKIEKLIIPDLPFDTLEYLNIKNLYQIQVIPVIAANIEESRLNKLLSHHPNFIYIMSGFRVTGSTFDLQKDIQLVIKKIKEKSSAKIGIGFGINSRQDVLQVAKIADVVIIGSSLLRAKKIGKLQEKLLELTGKKY